MKVEVIKAYGNFEKGETITRMHPSTGDALAKHGLVKIIKKETKKGTDPDDFYNKGVKKEPQATEEDQNY